MSQKVPFPVRRTPASPRRVEPLPESQPKAPEDDREAPERLQALMESPSYRRADRDPDFLQREELRASRLQLEYLKPDIVLADHAGCGFD